MYGILDHQERSLWELSRAADVFGVNWEPLPFWEASVSSDRDAEAEELNYSQWQIHNAVELLRSPSGAAE